ANKIVQLDGSARLPGVDGSQVTNINATRIGTRTIASSAPLAGQVIGWNSGTVQWEPINAAASSGAVNAVQMSDGAGGFLSNNNIVINPATNNMGLGTS